MQTNSVIIASAVDRCSFPIKLNMDRERRRELKSDNGPEGQGRSAAHPVSVNGCYPWGQERSAAHPGGLGRSAAHPG